jgi:hypothetical protein
MDSYTKKRMNKTLKVAYPKFEQKLWNYWKENGKDPKVAKMIKAPTVANLPKWFEFWKDKINFTELDIDYFELVLRKR